MQKNELAHQLRKRQYAYGAAPKWLIDSLNDDEMINAYVTCSDCGHKQIPPSNLPTAVTMATDVNHFIKIIYNQHKQEHSNS